MPINCNHPETHSFDLVVIGGGITGLCAAIAAAREGAKVALIQDRSVFGGNCSSEIRVVPHGAAHSNAWAGETGLPHALILEDRATNHEAFVDHGMINSHFDFTLMEAAQREPNLKFFLNTTVRGVDSEPVESTEPAAPKSTENGLGRLGGERRRIIAVVAGQMGSEKEFRFVARQFMDSTGDGTIGFLAGADFRYGREARSEFGEALAPQAADDVTMGATITMRARDIGQPTKFEPPSWIQNYRKYEEIGFKRTIYHITKPVYGGYWWLEVCNPFHQIRDNAEIRHELHRHVLGVWNFIKNHADFREKAANYVLDWIGMVPGKRESRRLVGDVTLTEQHCHVDQRWPDAIGYAGWWIDLHIKGGILNKKDPGERENADRNYKHWIRVPVFTLPLRCFYSRNIENLWMAGRCLSTTHVGLGPVRVMQTLAQMGQAVGIAAAYATQRGLTSREVASPSQNHIQLLQQRMLREDVRIPGIRNTDAADLALSAKAASSSEAILDLSRVDQKSWFYLGTARVPGKMNSPALSMVVPLTEGRLDSVEFFLRNESADTQRLTVSLQRLDRIWDRDADQPVVATATVTVPVGSTGWCRADFGATLIPGHPYRIAISNGESISWASSADSPPGTTMQYLHICPGGPEPKNAHLEAYSAAEVSIPAYRHWRQLRTALAMKLSPAPKPFGPHNVNNGVAWPESLPNLWVSGPTAAFPQWVELRWPDAVGVSAVDVSFDTNLARANQSMGPFFRAPECARDWRLLAETPDGWSEVFAERGNFQRKRRARFPQVTTAALRLEILATNGATDARVYELRAYRE